MSIRHFQIAKIYLPATLITRTLLITDRAEHKSVANTNSRLLRQNPTIKMADPTSPRCRSAGEFLEPESKVETSEYFSPDILHVLMGDAGNDTPSIFSKSLSKSSPRGLPSLFPQFQHLPTELRYLIWEAAVPEPTVVPRTWGTFTYNLQRKVPAVLQACSESRRHLISQPQTSRRFTTPKYQMVQTCGRGDENVYMDWQADSIWIYRGCESTVAKPRKACD